ncbi:MAG: hypothetical protein MI810_12890 [Flavobacteriales bacterium]|nr:hypothetical protein [Flavobacteriales bacterium]
MSSVTLFIVGGCFGTTNTSDYSDNLINGISHLEAATFTLLAIFMIITFIAVKIQRNNS